MRTTLLVVYTLLVLSQVSPQYSGNIRDRLNNLFGDQGTPIASQPTVVTPEPQTETTPTQETISEPTPSEPTPETPTPETPESLSTPESITTPSGESTVTTPETISTPESTESTESSTTTEQSVSEPTPVETEPVSEPVVQCQPYQLEVNGVCICDDDRCNDFLSSHSCTEESAAGICQCSDMECAIGNQVCSEETFEGECTECREDNIEECDNHQTCYRNTCVCIDFMCEDDLVCDREFSATTLCVECRVDSDCQDFEICNDDGSCECRDELTAEGTVCSVEDVGGEEVECRDDNLSLCEEFEGCNADNECACFSENCPQFTACDQEGDADGTCSVAIGCQVGGDDCPEFTVCTDNDSDDGMAGNTIVDDRDDNRCVCDTVNCPMQMTEGGTAFACVAVTTGAFTNLCLAPCTTVGDYAAESCPAGTACLASGATAADPPVLTDGSPHCFPTDILCRAENGVLLDTCDEGFSCVGESLIEGVETSPFCAPLCSMSINYCADYPCPEGFTSQIFATDVNDATVHPCVTDDFDTQNTPLVGLPTCLCVNIEGEPMEADMMDM